MYSKMQGRGRLSAEAACGFRCRPREITTTSPFSMSRTNFAPMMSSAQVSDARIRQPSSSPSTSGRMPSGSRAPISFLLVRRDQGIGAFDLAQRLDEAVDEAAACFERATRCRITSVSEVDWQMAPLRDQLAAQGQAIGEVAVVGDGEAAGRRVRRTAAARCAGWFRRWWNSGRGRWRACRAGGR